MDHRDYAGEGLAPRVVGSVTWAQNDDSGEPLIARNDKAVRDALVDAAHAGCLQIQK